MAEVFIRINPRCKRSVSVVGGRSFQRDRGWYGPVDDTDPAVATLLGKLETISDNDSNPGAGQRVFDIRRKEQAKAVEEAEAQKEDPRGTIENPAKVPGAPIAPPPPATDAPPQRRRRPRDA